MQFKRLYGSHVGMGLAEGSGLAEVPARARVRRAKTSLTDSRSGSSMERMAKFSMCSEAVVTRERLSGARPLETAQILEPRDARSN